MSARATRTAGWFGLVVLLTFLACTSGTPAPEPVRTTHATLPGRSEPERAVRGRPATTPARGEEAPRERVDAADIRDVGDTTIRVRLADAGAIARVASPGGLLLTTGNGTAIARFTNGGTWRIERADRRVRAVRPDGGATDWLDPPILAQPLDDALLSLNGKPYRGTAAFYGVESGVMVVNILRIDAYLLGVVPLEIGTQSPGDSAAVQAQAITARSYAYVHVGGNSSQPYDVWGTVLDQVYGGVAAETAVASQAVESTRTLVLKYNGRIVNAPYSSTCGGSTAAASEVWHSADAPYLKAVSDRIPGTDRYYCDIGSRFNWTRTIDGKTLNAALARYLAAYANTRGKKPGVARRVAVASHTPSGRVGTLEIVTNRGTFSVQGNDTRYVLRAPGGEILNSTNFTVSATPAADGSIGKLTIRGRGYGHGIGMCQMGAIGRARAGQDFRTILHTYYPGTTVAPPE